VTTGAGLTPANQPTWLSVIPENLPRELTDLRAWYPALIRPKLGKPGVWDKIPADPETAVPAKWSDPTTRCSFSDAYMAYQRDPRFHGVGFMLHAEAGMIGIDLDKCVAADGTVAFWALEIVRQFPGAYWERSISGTGLRGFCRGELLVGGCRSRVEGCSVELYADERFLVVTGHEVRP
jgi:primase-polymerase (primpol)-like protein